MFPKLSEKAYAEIDKIAWDNTAEHGVDAFMSLFNLEKYPITKDMLFEYFSNRKDIYQVSLNTFRSKCWEFIAFGRLYCAEDEVSDNIRWIAKDLGIDQIIIIGEIHGWWEKGE